jgi:biotin transporter BioY
MVELIFVVSTMQTFLSSLRAKFLLPHKFTINVFLFLGTIPIVWIPVFENQKQGYLIVVR